jgi:phosphoribosylanthranilate isomerase
MIHRTRIKICGITSVSAARVAVESGADAIGLVFAEDSPRRIDATLAEEIRAALTPFVDAVGVFRSRTIEDDAVLLRWRGEWCQVHGDADEQTLAKLAEGGRAVIRGFRFDRDAVDRWERCAAVKVLLIDGSAGGEGRSFDHNALAGMRDRIRKPIILAGGLTPGNVGEAIRSLRPYAVDVSSGVESSPGVKDPELVRAFCEAVRRADEDQHHQGRVSPRV